MNKSLLTGLVAGAAVATAGGVFAGYKMMSGPEFAQVMAVQPIMETVKTPRQVCQDVSVTHTREAKDQKKIAGTVIGAVVGGVLGNQIGDGGTGARSPRWRAPRQAVTPATASRVGCRRAIPLRRPSSAAKRYTTRTRSKSVTTCAIAWAMSKARCRWTITRASALPCKTVSWC